MIESAIEITKAAIEIHKGSAALAERQIVDATKRLEQWEALLKTMPPDEPAPPTAEPPSE